MSNFMNDERIVTWLDGELSSDEAAQLEAEIAASPNLQAEVEQIRAVKMAVQSLPRERAPRNFTLDVNEYGRTPRQRFSLFSSGRAMPALALAAVVLLFGFLLTQFPFGLGSNQEEALTVDTSGEIASAADSASDAVDSEADMAGDTVDAVDNGSSEALEEVIVEDAAEYSNSDASDDMVLADAVSESTGATDKEEDTETEAIAAVVAEEAEETLQNRSSANSVLASQAPRPSPAPRSGEWYDKNTYTYTFSGAMAEVTGTGSVSDTVSTTTNGSSTWVEALRDLTTGFLILLLIICLFAFGLGMWILVNRHQR